MINVKEEKVATALLSPSKIQEHANPLEFKKSNPATVVNLWIRSFHKWLDILDKWKKEGRLIDRLITLSLHGQGSSHEQLDNLHKKLTGLLQNELKDLEIEILEMQQNLDLLQRYIINTDVKTRQIKYRIQHFSNEYGNLKMNIFHELTNVYPIQIL
ncbi:MAG: hypothetical protein IPL46_05735 [Saprospiraceae bacterium]|nr:hypothetical protein [Saprospiraceae bacterium]